MNTYLSFIFYKNIYFPPQSKVNYNMNERFYGEYMGSMYNTPVLNYCEGSLGYMKMNNLYHEDYMFGFVEYENIRI